jgi:hypothetical protein
MRSREPARGHCHRGSIWIDYHCAADADMERPICSGLRERIYPN